MSSQKVLLVLTSTTTYPDGSPTGWYCPEGVHPYNVFTRHGFQVEFASITGKAVCDPSSLPGDEQCQKFMADAKLKALTESQQKVADVNPADYAAVLFVGGFGTMWDFPTSAGAHALIANMYTAGKPVGAVCHGPIVLAYAKLPSGKPICAGKTVTGFTNEEENQVSKYDVVSKPSGPGSCQDALGAAGGIFRDGGAWQGHVAVDSNLFTGQNPASAGPVATAMALHMLGGGRPTVTYWSGMASRAHYLSYVVAYHGALDKVYFNGSNIPYPGAPGWSDFHPRSATGALPCLTDGDVAIGESAAILRYLAKKFGIGASLSAKDYAESEMLIETASGIHSTLSRAHYSGDRTKAMDAVFAKESTADKLFGRFQARIGTNGWFTASGATPGELAFCAGLDMFARLEPGCLDNFPKLKALRGRVEANPGIQEVQKRCPYNYFKRKSD